MIHLHITQKLKFFSNLRKFYFFIHGCYAAVSFDWPVMRSDDPVCVLFCSGKVLPGMQGAVWQLSFSVRARRVRRRWRRRCPVRRGAGGARRRHRPDRRARHGIILVPCDRARAGPARSEDARSEDTRSEDARHGCRPAPLRNGRISCRRQEGTSCRHQFQRRLCPRMDRARQRRDRRRYRH